MGAALYSHYKYGELKSDEIQLQIGQGRITENLRDLQPDYVFQIGDDEAIPIVFDLLENEGSVGAPAE